MRPLTDLLKLDEKQVTCIQNAYLEAKTINFKKFFVGGEFVFSPSLTSALRKELEKKDPKVQTLVGLLEHDPLSLLRLISLAHSPVYIRASLVPTVTSLIQQFGYKRLPRLIEEASSGGAGEMSLAEYFARRPLGLEYLQRTILTAKLAKKISYLYQAPQAVQEESYLLGASMNIFHALLSFFDPDLLSAWSIDSIKSKISLQKNCQKYFISDDLENSAETLRKMSLPIKFLQSHNNLDIPPWNKRTWTREEQERMQIPCTSAYISNQIIDELFNYDYESKLYSLVNDLAAKCSLDYDTLMEYLSELVVELKESEKTLGITFVDLPGFMLRLGKKNLNVGSEGREIERSDRSRLSKIYFSGIKDSLAAFRQSYETRHFYNAVNLTMHLLVKVFKFDRAILFGYLPGENRLVSYLTFGRGKDLAENTKIKVEVGKNRVSPAVQAFFESKAIFNGDPIYEDNWPFITFPISHKGENYGVFYADLASKNQSPPLTTEEQMSVINLAELYIA